MPIPSPNSNQSQEEFMGVCMTFLDKEKSKYPEHKQRVAICLERYRQKNESDPPFKMKSFREILEGKLTLDQAKKKAKEWSMSDENNIGQGVVTKIGGNFIVSSDSTAKILAKFIDGKEVPI